MATISEEIAAHAAEIRAKAAEEEANKEERTKARFKALSQAAARGMFAALLGRLAAVIASGYTDWLQAGETEDDEEAQRLFAEYRRACDEQEDIIYEFRLLKEAQPEVAEEGWRGTFDALITSMWMDSEC